MSKRIYITLNEKKEKDRIILEFLNSTYNESDSIKNVLYQFALFGGNEVQIGDKLNRKMGKKQEIKDTISTETVIDNDKVKNDALIIDKDIMELFK